MNVGDKEPTHLPTVGCLRQIKYENRKSSYYDSNEMMALWIMSTLDSFKKIIRLVSLLPLNVYYWSPEQDKYYKDYSRNERTVLSIDATGSIFKPVGVGNINLSKQIFFYSCVMASCYNESSVPIAQLISDSHTLDTIHKWLGTWAKDKKIPNEVVIDDSAALIGAAVKAFTKFNSTTEYVNDSFMKLEKQEPAPKKCFIRIDTSHFIKILFNLPCFKHIDQRVKFFYIKCLLEIKECDDYNTLKLILTDIITLALNKYDGVDIDGNKTRCEEAKDRLKKLRSFSRTIDTEIVIQDSKEIDNFESLKNSSFEDLEASCETVREVGVDVKSPKWFYDAIESEKLIITLTERDLNNVHDNLFYFPDFLNTLTRLVGQLPLWSNIMKNIYHSSILNPTSSNVESYFKNVKRHLCRIISKSDRYRVDEFFMKHLEFLSGELKGAISNLKEGKTKKATEKRERKKALPKTVKEEKNIEHAVESIFTENPSLIENWRGLATKREKRKTISEKETPKDAQVSKRMNMT
ncbi:unnamed protein product [Diatraea saccharalis]|uniref:Transposase n=1 Tax=Diatraea saccharalis TaxID=40085 RepID=A0A9N9WGU7_9NEOP|nr:unnamed protein product [Diatraea saccharalis]